MRSGLGTTECRSYRRPYMNTSHTTGSARRLIQRGGGPGRAVGDPALVLGVAGQLPASKEPLRFWLAAWPLAPMIRWILMAVAPSPHKCFGVFGRCLVGGFVVGLVVALRRDEKKVTAPVPLSLTSSF